MSSSRPPLLNNKSRMVILLSYNSYCPGLFTCPVMVGKRVSPSIWFFPQIKILSSGLNCTSEIPFLSRTSPKSNDIISFLLLFASYLI